MSPESKRSRAKKESSAGEPLPFFGKKTVGALGCRGCEVWDKMYGKEGQRPNAPFGATPPMRWRRTAVQRGEGRVGAFRREPARASPIHCHRLKALPGTAGSSYR